MTDAEPCSHVVRTARVDDGVMSLFMTVKELRDELAGYPDHLPIRVALLDVQVAKDCVQPNDGDTEFMSIQMKDKDRVDALMVQYEGDAVVIYA